LFVQTPRQRPIAHTIGIAGTSTGAANSIAGEPSSPNGTSTGAANSIAGEPSSVAVFRTANGTSTGAANSIADEPSSVAGELSSVAASRTANETSPGAANSIADEPSSVAADVGKERQRLFVDCSSAAYSSTIAFVHRVRVRVRRLLVHHRRVLVAAVVHQIAPQWLLRMPTEITGATSLLLLHGGYVADASEATSSGIVASAFVVYTFALTTFVAEAVAGRVDASGVVAGE
jgi:hypothetical protein